MRRKFKEFLSAHRDLYEGLRPYADVGLIFSFDQFYWGNRDHLRQVHRIVRYLSDHHVLFDLITKEGLTREKLSSYRLLILPEVKYMSDEGVTVLRRFIGDGGGVIVTGEAATHRPRGEGRREGGFEEILRQAGYREKGVKLAGHGAGALVWARDLSTLVPERAFNLFDLKEQEVNDLEEVYRRIEESQGRPSAEGSLLRYAEEVAGGDLSVAPQAPPTLRFSVYRGDGKLVLHAVNYDVPRSREREGEPVPAEDVEVVLRVPEGWEVMEVHAYDPDARGGREMASHLEGERVRFTLGQVRVYKVVSFSPLLEFD